MDRAVPQRLDRLRAAWSAAWPSAWSDAALRSSMVDLHAWTHAMSSVLETSGPDSVPSAASHDGDDLRDAVVVMAGRHDPVVRAERSRPGWHLRGSAMSVAWPPVVRELVVLAVDEGDNEVVARVDVDAPGVRVVGRDDTTTVVTLDDVAVVDECLVHRPDVRAALADQATVVALDHAIARCEAESTSDVDRLQLVMCRAATRSAAISALSATVLRRQHDVSAAAVVTIATCRRLGTEVEPRHLESLDWHRERLVPLI